MNAKPDKVSKRLTSKQVDSKKRSRSVTADGRPRPTPNPLSKARECLLPWIKLANLLPPPPPREQWELGVVRCRVSMDRLPEWSARLRAVSPSELLRRIDHLRVIQEPSLMERLGVSLFYESEEEAPRLHALVSAVACTLLGVVATTSPDTLKPIDADLVPLSARRESPGTSRSDVSMCRGVISTWCIDPYTDFLKALHRTDVTHVRQCPICNHFFLPLRKDQKACCKRCNSVRRVRLWRVNQERYEYKRKLRSAGLIRRKKRKRRSNTRAR